MAGYNGVNGSACSQNSYLLNGLLKDELGFQGFVMSDWLVNAPLFTLIIIIIIIIIIILHGLGLGR